MLCGFFQPDAACRPLASLRASSGRARQGFTSLQDRGMLVSHDQTTAAALED